jgi:hypothetical protein
MTTCCTRNCREGRDCPARRPRGIPGLRPLVREAKIALYRWALHDLQRKDPQHEDIALIVTRLRDLRAERHAKPNALWSWL